MADPTLYLFDGWNLLHAGGFRDPRQLIDRLASFVGTSGARGIVVFDGVGADDRIGPLQIRFADDADSLLERLAAEHRERDAVCIVSSDSVVRSVSGQEVRTISSERFLSEDQAATPPEGRPHRLGDRVDERTRAKLERLRRGETPPRMHADEIDIDVSLVRRLLTEQFPQWAALPLEPVRFVGTDNAIFRLGDDMAVRLARRERTSATLDKERTWLPTLAPHLPLAVPVPLAAGKPTGRYPYAWAVYRWLPGDAAIEVAIDDAHAAAVDLAGFIAALQRLDPTNGPPPGEHNFFRGVPLVQRDGLTRDAIRGLGGRIDAEAVTAAWDAAVESPEWDRPPVWIHGDLDLRNLLVERGRLSGVIDFGGLGVGDPACDVMAAWKVLPASARDVFRTALGVDDATWARSRGWALSQAVLALAYYTPENNPLLVGDAERWIDELLAPGSNPQPRTLNPAKGARHP